jgi:ABC transport system ATP-binding/permease protein
MPPLLSCQSVSKSYSSRPLFRDITLMLDENERLGLIGPNGAGKSTLLKIFAEKVSPDSGTLTMRKGLRSAYVPQDETFDAEKTVSQILSACLPADTEEHMRDAEVSIMLTKMEFASGDQLAGQLSGGWRKRLSLACQLIKNPDLLLLDEPTNHLDLEGVLWLEQLLNEARFAFVVVTHDRTFLENVCERIVELNAAYAEGYLSVNGGYSDFLLQREQYMTAQAHLEQAMASKLRREIAWLQRGARARQKKSSGRIKEAAKLIEQHAEVKTRNSQDVSIDVDFSATGRKTKELLVAKDVQKSIAGRTLFSGLEFALRPGTKLGLLGRNGSGKTTLLRILGGDVAPDKGTIKRADDLRIVVFDQNRAQLDQTKSLKESLCPSGDSVVYRDRSLHVATWARRFLFRSDQLNMPISYLSGGEQARILIANLMLMPADILILDEPTNDLDIPSLEVLEDSLEDFPGAVVLVTHDRFLLDNVSNVLLALDGKGGARFFADYAQWEANRPEEEDAKKSKPAKEAAPVQPKRRGLSTNEKKELVEIPAKIEAAEKEVARVESQLSDQKIATDHVKLQQIMRDVEDAKHRVEALYERWQDLEQRAQEA